eukprot:maker-scaffold_24-snap-gene-5.46-mRNA-1 protein AED:0.26 eAED:0.26 QI:113/1/0.8/1/1/1/5/66/286
MGNSQSRGNIIVDGDFSSDSSHKSSDRRFSESDTQSFSPHIDMDKINVPNQASDNSETPTSYHEYTTEELREKFYQDQLDKYLSEESVQVVFNWTNPGEEAYVTGTFNEFKEKTIMHKSENNFLYVEELNKEPGKYAYKYIVDDEWRFNQELPTVADNDGFINNYLDISEFKKEFNRLDKPLLQEDYLDSIEWKNTYDASEFQSWYEKDPPHLPVHLKKILLNHKYDPPLKHPDELPVPKAETLNHLCCSTMKDDVMVLSTTERFREKFTTTVLYTPLLDLKKEEA